MNKMRIAVAILASLVLSIPLFSQSSNATVSGTVNDPSGAIVPGVTITATNNATGVSSTAISNEAGVYNITGLLPGVYKISSSLTGFRPQTFTDVQVGSSAQIRLNFALALGTGAQTVEVTIAAENLITSSSSSVGAVLQEKTIQDLPLVSNNVLDLVGVMAGVRMTNDAIFGAEQTNFAGVSARDINVQRDGISINNQRWPNGLDSPTRMNPDLVGEIKLILAPVDAEMGRGNGQVQIQTRSGTNAFHGALVWNVQNSALDANTWTNNSKSPVITPPWRNQHEYNIAVGGPIKKNKTFFYALWDQEIVSSRATAFPTVLTDCARRGIFRYFDNFNNGNANQIPSGGATPTVPTVNLDGSPRSPDGSPVRYLSVFGTLAANPTKNDCSDAQINTSTLVPTGSGAAWDPLRTQLDTSGFINTTLASMPHANAFDNPGNLVASTGFFGATYAPEGLNTATTRWVRTTHGSDNLFGVGGANNRKQINVKIDHNFNQRHKINGSYSYEKDVSDDAALPQWETIPPGQDIRKPQVLSVNFTSTLSTSMVNEARFGFSRTGANTGGSGQREDVGADIMAKLPLVNNERILTNVGYQNMAFGNGILGGLTYASHEVSPRWIYADTFSWTRGKHSFKFGGEYRLSSSKSTLGGSVQTGANLPTASIGNALNAAVSGIGRPGLTGNATSGNQQVAENMLTWLSGSLGTLQQTRFINELQSTWNDPAKDAFKIRDIAQNEFGSFVKDDWKVSKDLTLNLGMRWDFYGVPWERNGLTTGLVDGGNALFGLSGRDFTGWMKPGVRGDLMTITYVGPKSPNPDGKIYGEDLNNFGPAVGFSWQVPWGGKGKTTLRGGYQLSYLGGGRGFVLDTAIGNPPGSSNQANYVIPATDPYFSLAKLVANQSLIPVQPTFLPNPTATVIPLIDRMGLMNAFDPNYVSPYVQNLTLSATRNVSSKVSVEVRYIGTLSRKLYGNMDLNAPNFLYNGLKEAFDAARRGGESPLLDQMFNGLQIAGPFDTCRTSDGTATPCGPVGTTPSGGVLQTGAMHLRAFAGPFGTQSNLANGNYQALATTLNTLTNAVSGSANGSVLRYSGLFPENFIKTNPQLANAVQESNLGYANYHSMQSQVTIRPTQGLNLEVSYTFARNLGMSPGEGPNGTGATFTDPTNRSADYALLPSDRMHSVITYGSFALPLGPNKTFFTNATGFWARLAENWQASWILNMTSGAPVNIQAQSMLYGNGVPDVVGPFDKSNAFSWAPTSSAGYLFSDGNGKNLYTKVKDPQCLNPNVVVSFLAASCTLNAVANSSGQVVLQTPLPGKRGTLGMNPIYTVGTRTADLAIQKRIRVKEGISATVRLDATNVFNHPTPGTEGGFFAAAPAVSDLNLQSGVPFGSYSSKVGSRQFQLKARVDF
jgi:hypothetical protein